MCILFIHTDPLPPPGGYRVIVATNRDEYYSRPAEYAFHCLENNIIGGRDMEKGREGGMWLGVSLNQTDDYKFCLGCLLNLKGEEHSKDALGRGDIVFNYLKDDVQAEDYQKTLNSYTYSPFNFVSIELSHKDVVTHHQSNRPVSCSRYEGKQTLGFGNSTTSVPLQKVVNGRNKFEEIVRLHGTDTKKQLIEELTRLLKHDERYLPDDELERRSPQHEYLSSIYVRFLDEKYGTRAHSIILVDYDWNMDFVEIAMEQPINPEEPVWRTHRFEAQL